MVETRKTDRSRTNLPGARAEQDVRRLKQRDHPGQRQLQATKTVSAAHGIAICEMAFRSSGAADVAAVEGVVAAEQVCPTGWKLEP